MNTRMQHVAVTGDTEDTRLPQLVLRHETYDTNSFHGRHIELDAD